MRHFGGVTSALWLGVLCPALLAGPVLAQESATAGKTVTASTVGEAGAASAPAAADTSTSSAGSAVMEFDMSQTGNVTVDFRDADIRNVLKVLAYKSGVNMIAGPEVVGLVNIQLKDVPWQKALDVILSTYGYSYEQKGKIIMVTTVENLKKRREDAKALADQEPVTTETFVLSYANAETALKTLDKMKSARGSINFDQRTNSVIVTDVESNVALLREIVKRMDTITPQVLIEARIIETTLNKSETLGMKWPTSVGVKSAVLPTRATNFPWSTSKDLYLPAMTTTAPAMTYGTITLADLSAMLDILASRTNTNVISNPRIVTLDNQPAQIAVGSKYPLPKYTYSETQDKLILSGWDYIEYGLTFKVTPHINGRNMITLDLEPVITDSPGSVKFAEGTVTAVDIPILSTESAKTNVMIKDGETLVIAGLIKDKKTKVTDKVPVLGDIPLIGWLLFRHKTDTIVKTEMLIFLTPHIITPEADSPAESAVQK